MKESDKARRTSRSTTKTDRRLLGTKARPLDVGIGLLSTWLTGWFEGARMLRFGTALFIFLLSRDLFVMGDIAVKIASQINCSDICPHSWPPHGKVPT